MIAASRKHKVVVLLLTILILIIGLMPISTAPVLAKTEKVVAHSNGNTTVGELKEFMTTAFKDDAFRSATLSAVLKYYGLDDSAADTDVISNTKKADNNGPADFASPEEVLGWLGTSCKITVQDPNNLEGIQYLSKMAFEKSWRKYATVTVQTENAINMQTFWGTSNNIDINPNARLYVGINIDSEAVAFPMTNRQNDYLPDALQENSTCKIPMFAWAGRWSNGGFTQLSDPLSYLRDGSVEKKLVVNSGLRTDNGGKVTKLGQRANELQQLHWLETTDDAIVYQLQGGSFDGNTDWQTPAFDLKYKLWELRLDGRLGNRQDVSYTYSYQFSANYYSSVDIDVKHQVYGGFTFTKISENNNQLNLSGAQYVVKKDGKYLSAVGAHNTEAAFTDDIAKAKVFETDGAGTFEVAPVPEGNYEVIEVKAPAGYKLDPTPVSVKVKVDDTGIADSYKGAEGHELTVNADETTLTPHWEDGNDNKMTASGGTTTKNLKDRGVFIRNASEGGKPVTQIKNDVITDAAGKYTVLQQPNFTIKNLKGEVVKNDLNSFSELKNCINDDLIGKGAMKTEWDSYKITSSKDVIYYDTTSVANCTVTQADAVLPINIEINANKILKNGDALTGGEFEFTLTPDAGNPADDPFKSGKTVTNGADGKIDLGKAQFTKEGTYKYVLKETDGGTLGKQADITYDTAERNIEIEVKETGADGLTATVKIASGGKTVEKVFTSAQTNDVSYSHKKNDAIQNDQISQAVTEKYKKADLTEFVNSKNKKEDPTKPETPKDPQNPSGNTPSDKSAPADHPQTGDATPLLLMCTLITVSLVTIMMMLITLKHRKNGTRGR